jgi:plasmid stabilization system protein ParE
VQIRSLEDAAADLQAIFDTISRDRPEAAAETVGRIAAAVGEGSRSCQLVDILSGRPNFGHEGGELE